MSPKVLTDVLVLSTMAKEVDYLSKQTGDLDFWESVEPSLIFKLKEMDLDNLLNLMWSALEIEKGSAIFFEQIESEITKRILKIKDEEFQTLLACFINEKGEKQQYGFSEKFMDIVIKVIHDKKDRFQLRTLVHIIWALAKIDFNNERIIGVLNDLKEYPRL